MSQKGGSGKSTIASSLAVAAHETKQAVCVIDMDPQGSLTNWARVRGAGDIEVLASGAARLPALLASLERRGVTLALLDTPGAEGVASSAAMQAAELNIVPSRPSLFDLRACARTRAAIEEMGGEFVFLLNQCPLGQQTPRVQDGVEALEEMGKLISPLILARADYQEAARCGSGVTELNPCSAAAEEMRGLWQSIERWLSHTKPGRVARKA
ncbi:MAG: ParA family protein, partial [Hyphomicrobiales bacterium]|nr:ParA family protein [Hyphomicrobiales bacterium]